MKFELFEQSIKTIKQLYDTDKKLTDLLHVEGFIDYSEVPISIITKLLEDAFIDIGEWIQFWMWECDFGKDSTNRAFIKEDDHDKPVKLDTVKDLYKFLMDNYEDNRKETSE